MCGQGEACNRNICFFAHNQQELRTPGSEPPGKAARKKADAELTSRMRAAGASSSTGSSQQLLQVQQQFAQLGTGGAYQGAAGPGSSRSSSGGRGFPLNRTVSGSGESSQQQAGIAHGQGLPTLAGRAAGPGSNALAAAAVAAAAAAAGGSSAVALEQYQRAASVQTALQGSVPGIAEAQAGSFAGAVPAGGMYPVYGAMVQHQQQQPQIVRPGSLGQQHSQVLSPWSISAEALANLAAVQQSQHVQQAQHTQQALVPGVAASPGWGMQGYAPAAGPQQVPPGVPYSHDGAGQAGQMYPVSRVQLQAGAAAAAGVAQPVWVPDVQQGYGASVPVAGSAQAVAYAPAWQGAGAQQQGPPGQQPHQLMMLLHQQQHPGQAVQMLPVMQQGAAGAPGGYVTPEQYAASAEAQAQLLRGVQPYSQAPSKRGQ